MEKKLQIKLDEISAAAEAKYGQQITKQLQKGVSKVSKLNLISNLAKWVNQKLPQFSLETNQNRILTNADLEKAKYLLVFYRGSWCPYCTLTTQEYQKLAAQFLKLKIKVVLVSPELLAHSETAANEDKLEIANDRDNKLANALGISYKIDPMTRLIFRVGGINIKKSQANKLYTLPLAATLLIENGILKKYYANDDYKQRQDPQDIIKELNLETN